MNRSLASNPGGIYESYWVQSIAHIAVLEMLTLYIHLTRESTGARVWIAHIANTAAASAGTAIIAVRRFKGVEGREKEKWQKKIEAARLVCQAGCTILFFWACVAPLVGPAKNFSMEDIMIAVCALSTMKLIKRDGIGFDWGNLIVWLIFDLILILNDYTNAILSIILFTSDVPFIIGTILVYIEGKFYPEKSKYREHSETKLFEKKKRGRSATLMDIRYSANYDAGIPDEEFLKIENKKPENYFKTKTEQFSSAKKDLPPLKPIKDMYSRFSPINGSVSKVSKKHIFTEMVSRVNALNSQAFQRLMKKYMRSLDQCMFIFEGNQKLMFNNFDNFLYSSVLGKHKMLLNHELLAEKTISVYWDDIFDSPSIYELKVQPETLQNVYNILSFLRKHMQDFPILKMKSIILKIEKHLQTPKKTSENIRTQKSIDLNSYHSSVHSNYVMFSLSLEVIIEIMKILMNYMEKSNSIQDMTAYRSLEIDSPMIFFYKNLYFRLNFVVNNSALYLFLTIMNIGEKVLLLDLSDKLEFKSQLIASLSHEMKTPLNYIISTNERIVTELESSNFDNASLEDISSVVCVAKKLDILVQNIVDYSMILSKKFMLNPEAVNIRDIIIELMEIYERQIREKELFFKLEIDDIDWITDKKRLRGLLSILVENSIKFTTVGGISLKVEHINNDEVLFCLNDTGEGMSQSDIKIIEEIIRNPLSSEKTDNSAGLGIGLRMAYNFIKHLSLKQSKLYIESVVGEGTRITFALRNLPKITRNLNNNHQDQKKVIERVKTFLPDGGRHPRRFVDFSDEEENGGSIKVSSRVLSPIKPTLKDIRSQLDDSIDDVIPSYDERHPKVIIPCNDPHESQLGKEKKGIEVEKKQPTKPSGEISTSSGERRAKEAKSKEPKNIFVVDDEILNINILKRFITSIGNFNIYSAYNGKDCLRKIDDLEVEKHISKTPTPFFCLFLVDYSMPNMNGDELTEFLRSKKYVNIIGDPPIIGISAHNDDRTIQACLKAGMNSFEFKPVKRDSLISIAKRHGLL